MKAAGSAQVSCTFSLHGLTVSSCGIAFGQTAHVGDPSPEGPGSFCPGAYQSTDPFCTRLGPTVLDLLMQQRGRPLEGMTRNGCYKRGSFRCFHKDSSCGRCFDATFDKDRESNAPYDNVLNSRTHVALNQPCSPRRTA